MNIMGKMLQYAVAVFAISLSLSAVAPVHAQGPGPVYCASNDNRFARCQVPWRDAELVQQMSKVRCERGQTWGFDRGSIWVDRGCRGQFAPAHDRWGGGRPGWNQGRVRCESSGGNYQLCPADLRRGDSVRIANQLSSARCRQGDSWGWQPNGIWVNRGCRADFIIDRR